MDDEREGATADRDDLAASIRSAWRWGDGWLRACAVRASRHAPSIDPNLFATGGNDDPIVSAELAALVRHRPARGRLPAARGANRAGGQCMLTLVERVLILKGADLLNDVGPRRLLGLANVAREVEIFKGDAIYQGGGPGGCAVHGGRGSRASLDRRADDVRSGTGRGLRNLVAGGRFRAGPSRGMYRGRIDARAAPG